MQNLDAIAKAFGRHAIDLIALPLSEYTFEAADKPPIFVAENVTQLPKADPLADYLRELIALTEAMNDQGRWQLIGQAKLLAATHPKAKANPAS